MMKLRKSVFRALLALVLTATNLYADQITVDSGLSLGRLIELGRVVLDLESKNIQTATLPVEGARIDGRDVVLPIVGESQAVLEAFANGSPYPE